jgi:hypothetical protein
LASVFTIQQVDINYPTDLKMLNEETVSSKRIVVDLCEQPSDLRKHRQRSVQRLARTNFPNVGKKKKPLGLSRFNRQVAKPPA